MLILMRANIFFGEVVVAAVEVSGGANDGDVFCLILKLKFQNVRRASLHLSFMGNYPTISQTFLVLST